MRHRYLALLPAVVVCFAALSFGDQHLSAAADAMPSPGASTEAKDLDVETLGGVVTSIDARTGVLVLKTETGALTMHVPPGWATKVKPGDRVQLAMALEPAPPPAPASVSRDRRGLAWLLLLLIEGRGAR